MDGEERAMSEAERALFAKMESNLDLNRPEYDLSDPVVRLGVIVALRDLGYRVEP